MRGRSLRWVMFVVWVLAAPTVFGASFGGCAGDACLDGESQCDEHGQIVFCAEGDITGSRYFGAIGSCCEAPLVCVDVRVGGKRAGVCSATGQPDTRCANQNGPVCASDTTFLHCEAGFSFGETTCACVTQAPAGAFCALRLDPDPRCQPFRTERFARTCDGTTLVTCKSGFAVHEHPCTALPTCFSPSPGVAACASAESDPRCSGGPPKSWCEAAVAMRCEGTRALGDECEGGATCEEAKAANGSVVTTFCNDSNAGCAVE